VAAAQGAGKKEGAAVVVLGAAAEVPEMAVDDQAGKSCPAVAIGIVVEGADVGEQLAAARSAAGGDFGHHGKTPFLFVFIVGHHSALALFGNYWRRVKFLFICAGLPCRLTAASRANVRSGIDLNGNEMGIK
jgi:hypothetical protein